MTTLLAPRFDETFQARTQAAPGYADTGRVMGAGISGGGRELARAADLVKQFTYWTYVALRPICNLFAEQTPQLSVLNRVAKPGGYRLGQRDREWVTQRFGYLQSVQDDLTPLPDNHKLRELLERVNPADCWYEFATETCQQLMLTGRFVWWAVPNGFRLPVELYVIPTAWATKRYGSNNQLTHWEVRTEAGDTWEFPADQVIEGAFKSPLSKNAAHAPLTAAPGWQMATTWIERAREFAYKRGTNPDVILKFSEKFQLPKDDIVQRIEAKFLARVGGVENAGKPLLLPDGVDAAPWSHAPREMDFRDTSDQNRDQVLALWGVPKTIAGITEDVNRAAFDGSLAAFCRMTMNPLLRLFAGILTEKLASRFDPRIRIWYRDCTPEDAAFALEQDKADFGMGAITPAEIRAKRGRDAIAEPAYDSGYLPAGLSPMSQAAIDAMPEPPAPPDSPDGEDDADDEEPKPPKGKAKPAENDAAEED